MDKKVLSEIAVYGGEVVMPKGFEIDRKKIIANILDAGAEETKPPKEPIIYYRTKDCEFSGSRPLDVLDTYVREHINLEHGVRVIRKRIFGNTYQSNEQSFLRHQVYPAHLYNSPDFTMIYAAEVAQNSCSLVIEYDDHRRVGLSCHIPLITNHFFMFPATQKYMISLNRSSHINCLVTMTYDLAEFSTFETREAPGILTPAKSERWKDVDVEKRHVLQKLF